MKKFLNLAALLVLLFGVWNANAQPTVHLYGGGNAGVALFKVIPLDGKVKPFPYIGFDVGLYSRITSKLSMGFGLTGFQTMKMGYFTNTQSRWKESHCTLITQATSAVRASGDVWVNYRNIVASIGWRHDYNDYDIDPSYKNMGIEEKYIGKIQEWSTYPAFGLGYEFLWNPFYVIPAINYCPGIMVKTIEVKFGLKLGYADSYFGK